MTSADQHEGQPMFTLADIRRLTGKSQAQVGEAMGVQQRRVSQIEDQFPDVTYDVALRYFQALGAEVRFKMPHGETVRATAIVQDPARAEALEKRRARNLRSTGLQQNREAS